MFLQNSNKPGSRSLVTTKSRLNPHNQKFERLESRKRSPENYHSHNSLQSPPSSTDVMVFTSSQSHHSSRSPQGSRSNSYPEYPSLDEMYKYVQDVWDQKMSEANAPNSKIKCLNLSKPAFQDKPTRKDSTGSSPPTAPVKRQSPHQHPHPNKKY